MPCAAHADEVATSMMLFVDPSAVDMTQGRPRVRERGRRPDAPGRTGPASSRSRASLGDPTLATRGERPGARRDARRGSAERYRGDPRRRRFPSRRHGTRTGAAAGAAAASRALRRRGADPSGCTRRRGARHPRCSDERFGSLWREMDAEAIGAAVHRRKATCGTRTARSSADGRSDHPEPRRTVQEEGVPRARSHPVQLNDIRCFPVVTSWRSPTGSGSCALPDSRHDEAATWDGARSSCAPARSRRLGDRSLALHRRPAGQHHSGADDSEQTRLARRPRRRLTRGPGSGLCLLAGAIWASPNSSQSITWEA